MSGLNFSDFSFHHLSSLYCKILLHGHYTTKPCRGYSRRSLGLLVVILMVFGIDPKGFLVIILRVFGIDPKGVC